MNILAIETSCDETAAAVITNGKVRSNVIASQAKKHNEFGGVVPEVSARNHVPAMIPTINLALKKAGITLGKVDYIAVTQGPGLMTSLMVGVDAAKALSIATNKPLIPINHIEGHIYANFAKSAIKFPALILTVSGGHTLLALMRGHGKIKILGETLDDAAGEAFDKTARLLGLGYPGGAHLSKLAEKGNKAAFNFPRPMIKSDNFNFSFSGLKTAVLYESLKHKTLTDKLKADLAASTQAAIVEVLVSKLEKATVKFHPKTIMLGGGVAANNLLRNEVKKLAKKYKVAYSIPDFEYCTDNAAMIGLTAYHKKFSKQTIHNYSLRLDPNLKLN